MQLQCGRQGQLRERVFPTTVALHYDHSVEDSILRNKILKMQTTTSQSMELFILQEDKKTRDVKQNSSASSADPPESSVTLLTVSVPFKRVMVVRIDVCQEKHA